MNHEPHFLSESIVRAAGIMLLLALTVNSVLWAAEEPTCPEFVPLFNGRDLSGWHGDTKGYGVEDGKLICLPQASNLFSDAEFDDFVLRLEFKLTKGANSGIGVRVPRGARWVSSEAIELQILDDTAEQYRELKPTQYHGSIYGFVAPKQGFLRPLGEWNKQEVVCKGRQIRITLNGHIIVDESNLDAYPTDPAPDGEYRPGIKRTVGHVGLLGHKSYVEFRSIQIKRLGDATQ